MFGLLAAGAGLLGSVISANASKSAAKSQADATEKGIEEQSRQFDLAWEATEGARDVADSAFGRIDSNMARFNQRNANLDARSQASRGRLLDQTGRANQLYLDREGRYIDRLNDRTGAITDRYTGRIRDATGAYTGGLDAATQRANRESANITGKYVSDMRSARDGMFDRADMVAGREFEADPGYAFRQAEGTKALERSAAARGNVLGAATQKDLTRFNQDLAAQAYGAFDARKSRDQQIELGRAYSTYGVDAGAAGSVMDARLGRTADTYGRNVNALASTYGADTGLAGDIYGSRMSEAEATYGRNSGLAQDALQINAGQAGLTYDTAQSDIANKHGRQLDFLNYLNNAAGLGQTGTSIGINAGTNAANQISGLYQNLGTAQANGAIGQANAWNAGIDNLFSVFGAAQQGMFGQNPFGGLFSGFGGSTPQAPTPSPVNPMGQF